MIRLLLLTAFAVQAQLVVTLRDGSRIVGAPIEKQLILSSQFGDLSVPIGQILDIRGDSPHYRCRLINGDLFTASLRTPHLHLRSGFGEHQIVGSDIHDMRPSHLQGIVAWWSGNGDLRDRWSQHHGKSSCGYSKDRHGRHEAAFLFEHGEEKLVVPDHSALDTLEAFTLAAWIFPRSSTGSNGYRSFIFSKWYSSAAAGNYLFGFSKARELSLTVSQSDNGYRDEVLNAPADAVPRDSWTHVAATFDHGHAVLYVSGKRIISRDFTDVKRTNNSEYQNDQLTIGGHWNENYGFRGAIDDAMVFARALTAAEIATLAGSD